MLCEKTYLELYDKAPETVAFCPYRVAPLGAHIDHQNGIINGFAIDKGIHIAYEKKESGICELRSLNFPKRAQFHVRDDDIVEGIVRVMKGAPEKKNGEDGLPIPPYAVYNIGGGTPENLLTYISTLQEELVRAGVLPSDYDFEVHRELVGMQPGDVPVTYADSKALE